MATALVPLLGWGVPIGCESGAISRKVPPSDSMASRRELFVAKEIERKFLVANDGWRKGVAFSQELRDGLISMTEDRKVRVRVQDDRAILTIKGARDGITRDEFEYPIPMSDAREMLEKHCGDQIVEKTRHHVPHRGLVWTVDVYRGLLEGIVIAEVELPRVDVDPPIPDWLGREVTGLREYRKINLVRARKTPVAG